MRLKPIIKGFLLTLITLGMSCMPLNAQKLQAALSHYSVDDGLTSNTIAHIIRDDYGYLWIGTWNGLSRFDGFNFFNYETGNASGIPLLHNRIMDMVADGSQNIWMRMYDGHIFVLNRRTDTIINPLEDMEGYEDIVSQADGELPGLNETLPKGVYYLTEKQAPATYAVLSQDLCFEIDDLGYIRKISGPGTLVQQTEQSGTMDVFYTINVENELLVTDGVMIRKVVTGDMGDKQKDFTFTVVQAPAGQKYTWEKNGVEQTLQIGMGDTFTLKHGETVQIFVPDETLLRISEANGQYNTTWVLNGEELNADQNNTVGFSDVGLLVVTNDYGTVAPTSYNGGSATVMFVIVLISGAILWILTKKRSKNNQKI